MKLALVFCSNHAMPARAGKRATHCARRDTGAPFGAVGALAWHTVQTSCIRTFLKNTVRVAIGCKSAERGGVEMPMPGLLRQGFGGVNSRHCPP